MKTFSSFNELGMSTGALQQPVMPSFNSDTAAPTHFVSNDVVTNNGPRAAHFRSLKRKLLDEKGELPDHDNPLQLDLPENITSIIGMWDEDDVKAARDYFESVVDTPRRIGKPAKEKAKQLLAELDKLSYQRNLPLDTSEIKDWDSDKRSREEKSLREAEDIYYKRGSQGSQKALETSKRVLEMIPRFDEIQAWEDSKYLPDIYKEVRSAAKEFDKAEIWLKECERELLYLEKYGEREIQAWGGDDFSKQKLDKDLNSAKRELKKAKDAFEERKTAFEAVQRRFDRAEAYQ